MDASVVVVAVAVLVAVKGAMMACPVGIAAEPSDCCVNIGAGRYSHDHRARITWNGLCVLCSEKAGGIVEHGGNLNPPDVVVRVAACVERTIDALWPRKSSSTCAQ